ncbi:threonine/serine ThrE exporter family protein [Rheinheimera metallidurans]|uniref:threonine/serine ThrE exporter family protein n=1 Tax=Rheinheimera metallidurans TaxID=2925781 RepID=UPI0030034896
MYSGDFTQKRRFIVKLGKMLHKYGTPASRLEAHLNQLSRHLGLNASFIISPTAMTFVIWSEGHEQEYTHAARVDPGGMDLGALSRTDELADQVLQGQVSLNEADALLDAIDMRPSSYSKLACGVAMMLSGGAFAMLMATSWNDVLWSCLLSLLVYLFMLWAAHSARIAYMLEPLVALVAAVAACAISRYIDPGINIRLAVLSAIIAFIPGLALTLGLAELAARHLVSGNARIMDAMMLLFKLYFGAFLGIAIGFRLFGTVDFIKPPPIPQSFAWLAVGILGVSLIILFNSRGKYTLWSLASGFIAYGVSIAGANLFDYTLGAFLGAFAVGIYSNLFTRLAKAPAVIVAMHGLIVLVPGSKTYIGLNSLISGQEFVVSTGIGQQTFLIFMSLIAGLIFANVALPPTKSL